MMSLKNIAQQEREVKDCIGHSTDHSHQWMDENGWTFRTVYLQDKKGNIYRATLKSAEGRERRIIYDINNVRKIDKSAIGGDVPSTKKEGARTTSHSAFERSIAQQEQEVKDLSLPKVDGQRYLRELFSKHGACVADMKEDLAQVNPKLHEWLGSINAKSSSEKSIAQQEQEIKELFCRRWKSRRRSMKKRDAHHRQLFN